jgi:hypothetical protein
MFRQYTKPVFKLAVKCRHTGTIETDVRLLNINIDLHDAQIHSFKQLQKEFNAIKARYDAADKDPNLRHNFHVKIAGMVHGREIDKEFNSLEGLTKFVNEQSVLQEHEKDAKPALSFFSPL